MESPAGEAGLSGYRRWVEDVVGGRPRVSGSATALVARLAFVAALAVAAAAIALVPSWPS